MLYINIATHSFKVRDKSLIIHKSTYHLFSLLILKRGFSSLQTRKTFGKILHKRELPLPIVYFFLTLTQSGIPIEISLCYFNNFNHPERD